MRLHPALAIARTSRLAGRDRLDDASARGACTAHANSRRAFDRGVSPGARMLRPAGWAFALAVALLAGCDGARNEAPVIQPVQDQVFRVDQGGTVRLEVSDAEGDALVFAFVLDPQPPSGIDGVPGAPRLEPIGGGALLTWTPSPDDAGAGEARYRALVEATDDRGASSAVAFDITVVAAPDAVEPLRIAAPDGDGVLVTGPCLSVPVRVTGGERDAVSIEVDTQAGRCDGQADCQPPLLDPPGPGPDKTLDWCPTAAQHAETVQHELRLQARSMGGDGVASKRFFARFHRPAEPGCGGEPPTIEHVPPGPQPIAGPLDYVITADIRDDLGIKVAPALAYAVDVADPPLDPGDIDGWQAVEFVRQGEGSDRWQAAIPNLNLEPDAAATIHYAIFAVDDDDEAAAACDQTAVAGVFTLDVAGGDEGAAYPPCTPCRTDAQCGGDMDRCALLFDGAFCALDCAGPEDCGAHELCVEMPTVEGDSAFLCVPADQNCGQLCEADLFERPGNDSPETAARLEPGPQDGLTLCDEDEDWFVVPIEAGDAVVVQAGFDGSRGDLDLGLQLPGEVDLQHQSRGGGGDREVVREPCAPEGGLALIAVWAYAGRVGPYSFEVDVGPGECDVPCVADRYEGQGNDELDAPPEVELPFASGRLTICRDDRDVFAVRPPPGKLLRADLQLQEERLGGDLGLRLWRRGEVVDESAGFRPAESVDAVTGLDEVYMVEVFGQTPRSTNTYTLRIEALDGMPCGDGRRCPQGRICSEGVCVEAPCRADGDCSPDGVCVTEKLGQRAEDDGGRCADRCRADAECDRGSACKSLGEKAVCMLDGAQVIGARCARHGDCAGQAVCLDLPGGYCGRVGCDACPDGTACAEAGGVEACLRGCDGPADCRVAERYACQVADRGEAPICLPEEPDGDAR